MITSRISANEKRVEPGTLAADEYEAEFRAESLE
jgi:hypothetical protein